jgi:hypothetical protein
VNPRIFSGVFPCGIGYADRKVEVHGDYKKLAFLTFSTLELEFYGRVPEEFKADIIAHAAKIQAQAGQNYQVSTSGQYVQLGIENAKKHVWADELRGDEFKRERKAGRGFGVFVDGNLRGTHSTRGDALNGAAWLRDNRGYTLLDVTPIKARMLELSQCAYLNTDQRREVIHASSTLGAMLDDKPATIRGVYNEFCTVSQNQSALALEWDWQTATRILANTAKFRS